MPSFEEDMFAKAQQMNRHQPYYHSNQKQNIQTQGGKQEQKQAVSEKKSEQKPAEIAEKQNQSNPSLLDMLFKNKEQSLILLLIILLMDENADPTLLLALVYLLI